MRLLNARLHCYLEACAVQFLHSLSFMRESPERITSLTKIEAGSRDEVIHE